MRFLNFYLKSLTTVLINCKKMSVFTQQYNSITGKLEWEMQPENYDWHQEVARSGYADMLHDTERNQKYYTALKSAITRLKFENREVRVLDIGTGTGLLSMMAVKCGADLVTACEAFEPMSKCALEIIKHNKMEHKITVIPKRSTQLIVGVDMGLKANILVTEVFDTELIGEGALSTFSHALNNLLEADSIIIPCKATVYAQIIQSDSVLKWNKICSGHFEIPKEVDDCAGSAAVHDIQMSQLETGEFTRLTEPIIVHKLDFSQLNSMQFEHSFEFSVDCVKDGKCGLVFMWWDVEMYSGGEILSCAPYWAHPDGLKQAWRDHWMQAVYYLPKEIEVKQGQLVVLEACHDEYSYWFAIKDGVNCDHPICSCGLHASCSRSRIGAINDNHRNNKMEKFLEKVITSESNVLCVGESIPLALIASKHNPNKLFVCEQNRLKRELLTSFLTSNNLNATILDEDPLNLTSRQLNDIKIDVLISEPSFSSNILPWDSIHFWYIKNQLGLSLLSPKAAIFPFKATLHAVAVQFKDLHKIRARVGIVEGFDLRPFDDLIQNAIELSDARVEPQPLWEYPGVAMSEKIELWQIDFNGVMEKEMIVEAKGMAEIKSSGICNGVAIWIDFHHSSEFKTECGPTEPIVPGSKINWYRYSNQGVYFFNEPTESLGKSLEFDCKFKPNTGKTEWSFQIV